MSHLPVQTVAIAGLGAIGHAVARALDDGTIPGLRLAAVAVRDPDTSKQKLAELKSQPEVVAIDRLGALADVVIECAPAMAFRAIAESALRRGRIFMPLSVGQMLTHMDLVDLAAAHNGRIVVPSGALLGLDAVRAVAEGQVGSVKIVTRKPPAGLKSAPWLVENGISVDGLNAP